MAKILVAEDNATERGLMARGLSSEGHTIIEAENGLIALQLLSADPGSFSAVVTDVEMPELDGVEFARRAMSANPGLKVIMISGHASSLDKAADLVARGARTLVKPVALDKVRAELRTLLG